MVIYRNTYKDFKRDVSHLELTDILIDKFDTILHRRIPENEKRSLENSLSAMYRVMNTTNLPDDCGISIEYNLPHTNRRIDFIIAGEDEKKNKNVVIVELKQWQTAVATKMDGVVQTVLNRGMRNTSHPSYQAYGYKRFLKDFNEAVYDGDIEVQSCAFLHNYTTSDPEPLLDEIYAYYIDDTPLLFTGSLFLKIRRLYFQQRKAFFVQANRIRFSDVICLYILQLFSLNGKVNRVCAARTII